MTSMGNTTPNGVASAPVPVAESLSTVGYAMFAFLQHGPLEDIPSLRQFVERTADETIAPTPAPPAYTVDDTGQSAFGHADIDHTLDAVPAHGGLPTGPTQVPGHMPTAAPAYLSTYSPDEPTPAADPPSGPATTPDQPGVPLPGTAPVPLPLAPNVPLAASSVQIPVGPPTHVPAPADEAPKIPPGLTQPKNPPGTVPEYTGNQTLAMLQEISFLDE